MKKNQFKFFITSLLFLVIVITGILIAINKAWYYYLFGLVVSIIAHLLMVLQNKRFDEIQNSYIEKPLFHAGKFSLLWMLLRLVITTILTLLVVLFAKWINDSILETTILYILGYTTYKVIFISNLMIFRKRG